jgi:hypothetical protein
MESLGLWLLVLLVVLVLVFVLLRSRSAGKRDAEEPSDRLDTVAAWPAKTTRVLTTAERLAYTTLVRALPGYMVLAQVPLARFLKVPTRHSYSEWLRRLGNQCADFLVCDMSSEVIAVVNVQPPADQLSERGRKRQNRMARVLKSVNIPLHVWTDDALPSVDTARETLLPKAAAAPAPAEATPFATPPKRPTASRPAPLEPPDDVQDGGEVREPTPSTWFDEFNSGPAPLPGGTPRTPR